MLVAPSGPRVTARSGCTSTSAGRVVDVVDGEVRELIPRRGLDPFTEWAPSACWCADVVADYSGGTANLALSPIVDTESVVGDVLDRGAGVGPLQRYLDDAEIETLHGQLD